jgi:hypothetical protein
MRDPGPRKTGTASLSGRVTALDTARPIRRAQVRAGGPEIREGKVVSTDADGRWTLKHLPAGRYRIDVTKGGYVAVAYGQRRPFEAGKTVDLLEAQELEKLDVALPRGSAINGRVVDEFGEPMANVRVSPMRFRFIEGRRRLINAGGSTDTTDDLGQYRLHGLPPGEYYVVAQQPSGFLASSEDRTGYAQTYHPGALTVAEATRVPLTVGQEAHNVLVTMTPTRTANLSGTAVNSAGQPIAEAMGFIRENTGSGMVSSTPVVIRDGNWTVSGLVAGEYVLSVHFIGNLEQVAVSGGTGNARTSSEFIVQPLTITGEDLPNIVLRSSLGGTLKGRVNFDGTANPPAPPPGARMTAMEPRLLGASINGRIRPDWSFELTGLFGKRLVRPLDLPRGWTLASVALNGDDVTDTGVEVGAGTDVSGVEVTVTQQAAELGGSVATTNNAPVADFVVILFPAEAERWGPRSRFIRVAAPDQTGRFTISGILAGSYLAAALDYMEPGEESNPEFLEKLKTSATNVRLGEGERKTLTLTLIAQ